jgi:transposase-like protein
MRLRHRWSDEIKGRIVAESFLPDVVTSELACRHGLSPQHLSARRKAARAGLLRLPAETPPAVAERCRDGTTPAATEGSCMTPIQRACSLSSRQAAGAIGRPGPTPSARRDAKPAKCAPRAESGFAKASRPEISSLL